MNIDSMMIELTHGCHNGTLGKYTIKTETAFINHYDMNDSSFDLEKVLFKAIGSLKAWDDHMQISIRENECGSYCRKYFITSEYDDRQNGTLTIARCHDDGTFEYDDRKHKTVKIVKAEIRDFIHSLTFIENRF